MHKVFYFRGHRRPNPALKGFSLIELAIVFGVIGLILGAIWTASAGVAVAQRGNKANQAVMYIAQHVRGIFAANGSTGYSAITDITAPLIAASAVPADMINGSALKGPFSGGATTIRATPDGNGFTISMTNVPQGSCVDLLMAVANKSRDPALFRATASTTPDYSSGTAALAAELAITDAQTACASTTNTVVFGFFL